MNITDNIKINLLLEIESTSIKLISKKKNNYYSSNLPTPYLHPKINKAKITIISIIKVVKDLSSPDNSLIFLVIS